MMTRFVVDHLDRSGDGKRVFLVLTCLTRGDADLLEERIREALLG